MAFSQATISEVRAYRDGAEFVVEWTSSAPAGTWFHVYEGAKLRRSTQARRAHIPVPAARATLHVGTVLPAEATLDLSGSLPATPADRVRLDWLGGTFLDENIAGFRVYGSAAAGGAVDYDTALADIPAYSMGMVFDGWNMGGWNQGGWGHAASSYSWTSAPLSSGDWTFAVVPYNAVGNESATAVETTETVLVAPQAPAMDAAGKRLTHTYDEPSGVATLHWLASPS
jgi:hypothetical protein